MIRDLSAAAFVMAACSLLAAPIAAQEPASAQDEASTTTPSAGGEYVVGIGDVVRITVWRNDELETLAPVRPDGRISAVLVGDVAVAGLTPGRIRELLTRSYEEYVNAPGVSVIVTEINSRRVYVLGEVSAPGVYDLGQPTRLLQALAMAGGLTEFAKKDEIVLLRDVEGQRRRYLINLKTILSGARTEDDVLLLPGDTIVVP